MRDNSSFNRFKGDALLQLDLRTATLALSDFI
jgi:hypothetical protein